MHFAKVLSGIVTQVYTAETAHSEDDHEITKEQFDTCPLPCYATVDENGVTFGEKAPWDDVPDMSVPADPDQPEAEQEPSAEDAMWAEMAAAIREGVNAV